MFFYDDLCLAKRKLELAPPLAWGGRSHRKAFSILRVGFPSPLSYAIRGEASQLAKP